jgi:hypothetical protein
MTVFFNFPKNKYAKIELHSPILKLFSMGTLTNDKKFRIFALRNTNTEIFFMEYVYRNMGNIPSAMIGVESATR